MLVRLCPCCGVPEIDGSLLTVGARGRRSAPVPEDALAALPVTTGSAPLTNADIRQLVGSTPPDTAQLPPVRTPTAPRAARTVIQYRRPRVTDSARMRRLTQPVRPWRLIRPQRSCRPGRWLRSAAIATVTVPAVLPGVRYTLTERARPDAAATMAPATRAPRSSRTLRPAWLTPARTAFARLARTVA